MAGYKSFSFDPDSVASTSDVASAASQGALSAFSAASDALSRIAAVSDKASKASQAAISAASAASDAQSKIASVSDAASNAQSKITARSATWDKASDASATASDALSKASVANTTYSKFPQLDKTDNYVIQVADLNKMITMTNAAAKQFTLPSIDESHIGSFVIIGKLGAGKVTVVRADADTINGQTSIYNGVADELFSFMVLHVISSTAWAMREATNPFSWVLA